MTQSKGTVFITGASSGIGKELAHLYAKNGYNVAITARREALLNSIADELSQYNVIICPIQCDVQVKESVRNALDLCYTTLGPIDILIANAGISHSSPSRTLNSNVYKKTFDTNVMGAIYCFEYVIPKMCERGSGQLVGISSLASYRGLPEAGAYCASKAALSTIMDSLRLDLKKHGLTITLINPGFIKTPLTDKNNYYMPFLMSIKQGGRAIFKAIQSKKTIYAFPWPLALMVRCLRLLPSPIFDFLLRNRRNIKHDTI